MPLDLSRLLNNIEIEFANVRISLDVRDELVEVVRLHHGGTTDEWVFRDIFGALCVRRPPHEHVQPLTEALEAGERLSNVAHRNVFLKRLVELRDHYAYSWTKPFMAERITAALKSDDPRELGTEIIDALDRAVADELPLVEGLTWLARAERHRRDRAAGTDGFEEPSCRACLPFELGLPRPPNGEEYVVLQFLGDALPMAMEPTVLAGDPVHWLAGGRTCPRSDGPPECDRSFRSDSSGRDVRGLPEIVVSDISWRALVRPTRTALSFFQAAG